MLTRSFLTAVDLGISELQWRALIEVLGMLEREEIQHVNSCALRYPAAGFNMNLWEDLSCDMACTCGVRCIGAWAEHIGRIRFESLGRPEGLERLFLPDIDGGDYDYDAITPAQAAAALSNYLTTGEPRWREVLVAERIVI
jgi:hypothetical protein